MRIMDGTFINVRGGAGNNLETDLVKEHSIRNRKELIKSLGANKSEGAILRVTSAADTVAATTGNFARSIGVKQVRGRHTSNVSEEDRETIKQIFRAQRPFNYQPGRKFERSKLSVPWSPFYNIDRQKMSASLEKTTERLKRGFDVECEVDPVESTEQRGLPDMEMNPEEFFG